jgi:hypothetical protein
VPSSTSTRPSAGRAWPPRRRRRRDGIGTPSRGSRGGAWTARSRDFLCLSRQTDADAPRSSCRHHGHGRARCPSPRANGRSVSAGSKRQRDRPMCSRARALDGECWRQTASGISSSGAGAMIRRPRVLVSARLPRLALAALFEDRLQIRIFGSWRNAVTAAGIHYDSVLLRRNREDDELLAWLRPLARTKPRMSLHELEKAGQHAVICRRRWGVA